jgi:hypothetical protein
MTASFTGVFGSPEQLLGEINEDLDVESRLLDSEIVAAAFVAMTSVTSSQHLESVLVHDLVPRLATSSSPSAVPVLLALGDVADGRVRTAATKAAIRLLHGGHVLPPWAADLAVPTVAHDCYRVLDTGGRVIEFGAALERAARSWLVWATLDESIGEVDSVEYAVDRSVADRQRRFRDKTIERLDSAEFVRQLEAALGSLAEPEIDPYVFRQPGEDDLLGSPEGETSRVLLRSWLSKVAPT